MSKPFVGKSAMKRSSVVALIIVVAVLLLAVRIFSIQVLDFARYQKKVIDQLTTESPVKADRGEILDAAGRVLATNRTVYRISVFPNVINRAEGRDALRQTIADGLAAAIPSLESSAVLEHLDHTTELERTVARSVEADVANAVLRLIEAHSLQDMVAVEAVSTRYYPYGELASHLLGSTGSDGQGLYGVELQYDEALAGESGSYVTVRDSMGNELPGSFESFIEPVDGQTLQTTLDAYVQAVLEEQLERAMIESVAANRVCGIVMDVKTGAILAMATGPSFDLNAPFQLNDAARAELEALGLLPSDEGYAAAKNQLLLETWSNKSVTEIYMPGSTFKTVTCSAVIEEGAVIDPEERFFCSGSLQVADRTIRCHKVGGHGSLTFREGLQNSCNPVMMTVAARLGCDTFYEYVKAFGFLERTGIDLPGEGNSIFHAASNFTELDLATASFGQNFKVTPLQLLCAVSAIANGGELLTPYVVQEIIDANGESTYTHEREVRRRVISEETARLISDILAEGVAGDGGAKNAYVAGYRVAAKTGTSEKIGDDKNARISSCVAFAPADDPQIAMIFVVDEPTDGVRYGSVVAAPFVAATLEAILPYLGVEPVYTEEELARLTVPVPNCVGKTREQAQVLLAAAGFSVTFTGEGEVVSAQTPMAGTRVAKEGACVSLVLGDGPPETVILPSLVGMTVGAANRVLADLGLNLSIMGGPETIWSDKVVLAQSLPAGEAVKRGTVIKLFTDTE